MLLRLQTAPSIFLLFVAFLFRSASCGKQDGAKPAPPPTFAFVQSACGPLDGPAIEFYFTGKQVQPGSREEPYLVISVNENLPTSRPQDYSIKPGSYAVLASRCLGPGRCDAAISGNLHLATFNLGKGASGEYELYFEDGKLEMRSFDASWFSGKPLICG